VILAAVKVVTTTYQRKQGSFRLEVVRVSGSFAAACDALAEAYVTCSRAAMDARSDLAAHCRPGV
jgi:hypothetical protein